MILIIFFFLGVVLSSKDELVFGNIFFEIGEGFVSFCYGFGLYLRMDIVFDYSGEYVCVVFWGVDYRVSD